MNEYNVSTIRIGEGILIEIISDLLLSSDKSAAHQVEYLINFLYRCQSVRRPPDPVPLLQGSVVLPGTTSAFIWRGSVLLTESFEELPLPLARSNMAPERDRTRL